MPCRVLKNKGAIITSKFGYRTHPTTGIYKLHNGVDIVGDGYATDYIVAHTGGTVETATYNSAIGNYVNIRITPNVIMQYCHMSKTPEVKVGQTVKQGDVLGYMGSTGQSTGAHLHFGIKVDNEWIDPEPYLYSDYLEDEEMSYETFVEYMNRYNAELSEKESADWAKEAWQDCVEKKVFDGTRPQAPLTRQEAAVLISRGQI